MKRSLMRPTAALFALVLMAASMFGNAAAAADLFLYYCIMQLCSLCSADAFRNAAAREPGVRRVDRRFSGAWPVMLIGIALCMAADRFFSFGKKETMLAAAAGCIIIEQLFEERMFALSHPSDGAILSIVSNVLLFAGMMIDSSGGLAAPMEMSGFYTACGAGLGMLISIAASYIIEPMHAFSLVPRNLAFFPKAAAQSLLYPVVIAVLTYIGTWLDDSFAENLIDTIGTPEFMLGFMLWRLSRTVCRRAQDESRPLNLILIAICAVLIMAGIWMPGYYDLVVTWIALITWIVLICAAIIFCAPGWRLYTGIVLLYAAIYFALQAKESMIISTVCAAIAVILNLHKAFLRKV